MADKRVMKMFANSLDWTKVWFSNGAATDDPRPGVVPTQVTLLLLLECVVEKCADVSLHNCARSEIVSDALW